MRIYNYIIILIFILFPILYINDFKFNWEIGLFILIYLIIYLGTPLLYRKEKSYLDKFKQHEKTENSVESLLDKLGNLIGGKKLIGFILFVYLLGVSFLLGNFNAVEKEDFVVANINGDNFVIVKIHKESVILLEIDAEKKTFNNRFYIKERTQLANFLLERKMIGSLISIDKENGKK
jgi:hypothetical protein